MARQVAASQLPASPYSTAAVSSSSRASQNSLEFSIAGINNTFEEEISVDLNVSESGDLEERSIETDMLSVGQGQRARKSEE